MQKSFVAFALAVFSLSAVSDAAAQDAPRRFSPASLSHVEGLRPRQPRRTYPRQDSRMDGLIKGALLGVLMAVVLERGLDQGNTFGADEWATIIGATAGAGYVVDVLHSRRDLRSRPGEPPLVRGATVGLRF